MSRSAASLAVLACLALPAFAQDVTPSQKGGTAPAQKAAPAAVTAPQPPAASPAIGPDVVMVRVAGPWETANDKGFSRMIATATGGKLALRVEWVSDDGKIVHSGAIETPESAEQLPLATVRSETGPADSAVYFDTPEDAQGFRETFVLIVGAPGEAKFGPATN